MAGMAIRLAKQPKPPRRAWRWDALFAGRARPKAAGTAKSAKAAKA
jgi:hypothetical protein